MPEKRGSEANSLPICLLIPVFNDWQVAELLAKQLDGVLQEQGRRFELVLVDDGSAMPAPEGFLQSGLTVFSSIEIVELRTNIGHQRALSVGMVHLHRSRKAQAIVIMDADGEDAPADVPVLLHRYDEKGGEAVIFASRTKRAEGFVFKLFYRLFQIAHWLLVGSGTKIGNFSVLPFHFLDRLVAVPELWNHYAASVIKSRLQTEMIPVARAKRLGGRSRMGFVRLVIHGLSAISVYGDIVGVRLVLGSSFFIFLALCGVAAIVAIRLGTNWAIPGWTTTTAGLLLVLAMQGAMLTFMFTFLVLYNRSGSSFIPMRDCLLYIARVRVIVGKDE